jgi:hypothetical protein
VLKVKKIVSVVIALIIICSFTMVVNAETTTTSVSQQQTNALGDKLKGSIDTVDSGDASKYAQKNAELIAKGQAIQKLLNSSANSSVSASTSVILTNFPHYYQNGYSWSSNIMQTGGDTIGLAGCALTAWTDILDWSDTVTYNPGTVNTMLGSAAEPFNYNSAPGLCSNDINLMTYEYGDVSSSTAISYIIGSLNYTTGNGTGLPVLVGMYKGTSRHFVPAYGYSGSTIYINDPLTSPNYTTLQAYLNAGYTVNRLYTV